MYLYYPYQPNYYLDNYSRNNYNPYPYLYYPCYPVNYYNPYLEPHTIQERDLNSFYPSFYRNTCREAARINATMDYVGDRLQGEGFIGGLPNFHEAIHEGTHVYGTFLLKQDAAEHIPNAQLGFTDRRDVGAMMRAANDYASTRRFAAGIPTFHKDRNNYGVLVFRRGTVDYKDVRAVELGYRGNDVGKRFRSANDYAVRNGYIGGFPNFHQQIHPDTGLVYGIMLLKSEAAEWRDIPSSYLNLARYESIFCS